VPTAVPGAGRYRFVSTRDVEGTYAMVYAPTSRSFSVRLSVIRDPRVRAWWFDPRTGRAQEIGVFDNTSEAAFTPPDANASLDWVLVLDAVSKRYPAPGAPAAPGRVP
jgi:hypothetical protein